MSHVSHDAVYHDTYVSWWLERLKPGTLLYNKHNPDWGFWLVYHCEDKQYGGSWRQLLAYVVDPRLRLSTIELEANNFFERWAVVEGT